MENRSFALTPSAPSPPFPGVFEPMIIGIAYVDLQGKWLGMNKQVCRITGYSREELLRKTLQEMMFFPR